MTPNQKKRTFHKALIDTALGPMVAIADEAYLYLLEFVDCRGLEREIERLRENLEINIIPGGTPVIDSIKNEITHYFENKCRHFTTPIHLVGTPFQKQVWENLKKIPPSETRSYADIAKSIGRPNAYRAVAQAIGANQLALIIPCHRVINSNGDLGGYAGGINRKQWLLDHERNYKQPQQSSSK